MAKTADARAPRLARLRGLQRRFDPLALDEPVAESYGRLAARVVATGRHPRGRVMDLLIAATAHTHGATLYTRNPDGLKGVGDLVDIVAV